MGEERGEAVILQVLDTLETHMEWMLVSGEEGVVTGSGPRLLQNPVCHVSSLYTISTGSLQDTPNSPAIKALTFCLRSQFVHIQVCHKLYTIFYFYTTHFTYLS